MARKSTPVVALTVKLTTGEITSLYFDDLAVAEATKQQLSYDPRVAVCQQSVGSMCKSVSDALTVFDRIAFAAMLRGDAVKNAK